MKVFPLLEWSEYVLYTKQPKHLVNIKTKQKQKICHTHKLVAIQLQLNICDHVVDIITWPMKTSQKKHLKEQKPMYDL